MPKHGSANVVRTEIVRLIGTETHSVTRTAAPESVTDSEKKKTPPSPPLAPHIHTTDARSVRTSPPPPPPPDGLVISFTVIN